MVKMRCQQICWLDLEMTGFDPFSDLITELAVVITDINLKPLIEYETGVYNNKIDLKKQLDKNDWFKEQSFVYQRNIYNVSLTGKPLKDIELKLLQMLDDYVVDKLVILAGNSIHMDRKFIDVKLPKFASRLHYRMLDITAYKIYLESVLNVEFEKKQAHRALDDVYESIAEFKFYLSKMNLL